MKKVKTTKVLKATVAITLALFLAVGGFVSCKQPASSGSGGDDGSSGGTTSGNGKGGAVAKASVTISGTAYDKTAEIVIIPSGTFGTINMTDDSSWSEYLSSSADARYKGVFIKDRNVTLSPFVMSQYEVTQELYEAVMGSNPSNFADGAVTGEKQELRPVEQVSWYDAIAFCNALTTQTMGASDCVYYSNSAKTTVYTTTDASNEATPYVDTTKKGYRLPTEAEWEYAARGGNPSAAAWKYAYAGSQTEKEPANFTASLYNDDKLDAYAWYTSNSSSKTHEVGKKSPNTLGLYDMSGNVWEWCWDWFNGTVETGDVTDPHGASSGSNRVKR